MSLSRPVLEFAIDGDSWPTELCAECIESSSSLTWLVSRRRAWLETHTSKRQAYKIRAGGSRCRFCRLVRSIFPADLPPDSSVVFTGQDDPFVSALPTRRVLREILINATTGSDKSCVSRVLGSVGVTKSHVDGCFSSGGNIHPQANISQIAEWLSTCTSNHDHSILDGEHQAPAVDILLIDVQEFRLVESSTDAAYAALSYVWGDASEFRCVSRVLPDIQLSQGLFRYWTRIPRVIRDAIDLVGRLGYQYLWVDSLCIKQDDVTQKHHQISQMYLIYRQAFLTIVAHSGESADSPLPGLAAGTRLEMARTRLWSNNLARAGLELEEAIFKDGEVELEILRPNPCSDSSIYEHRGWTLQERALSRRCLFFNNHNVWFQCSKMRRHDQQGCRSLLLSTFETFQLDHLGDISLTLPTSMKDCLHWYGDLIERYQRRHLSFSEDKLNAIKGMLTLLGTRVGGQVIGGIPGVEGIYRDLPGEELLWTSGNTSTARSRSRDTKFPSWSWAGWNDTVCFDVSSAWYWLPEDSEHTVGNVVWRSDEHLSASAAPAVSANTRPITSLIAWTQVVPAGDFVPGGVRDMGETLSSRHRTVWRHLLRHGTDCGVIEDIISWPVSHTDEEHRFILVSGHLRYLVLDVGPEYSRVAYVCAMLVKKCGSFEERLGIALIRARAWANARPVTRTVRLI